MNTIIANQKKSENISNVWIVSIAGQEGSAQFCKSPYTAMKLMFLLKSRTGFRISDNSLKALSEEIARQKSTANEAPVEEQPVEQPQEVKPAPKKRGRKPKMEVAA